MALNEAIQRHRGCRDSFVRNFAKGTIRQTITLDHIIGMLSSGGLKSVRIRPLIILRMGLYAIREMDSVPDHAAVNEAVSLARKTAKGTDRFVNAVLRSYIRRRGEFEVPAAMESGEKPEGPKPMKNGEESEDPKAMKNGEKPEAQAASGGRKAERMTAQSEAPYLAAIRDPVKRDSIKYSMPEALTRLIREQYGSEADAILKGLNTPPAVVIRTNTLRTTRDELIAALEAEGIKAQAAPESGAAVICSGSGLIGSDLYRNGMFTVQSLSSMMAIDALAPEPGSNVLDMCAAPGGKSTMMAELMENKGSITACDIHEHRLGLIEASAARTGADIIRTKLSDGTVFDASMEEQYDYVLADVPCSGLGVMSTKPEIRLGADVDSLKELADIQLQILRNAFRYTKPGGRLCYSTCTLNKEENEGVIKRFMSSDAVTLGFMACKAEEPERFMACEAPECTCEAPENACEAPEHSDIIEAGSESGFARIVEMKTVLPYNNLIGFYYCIIEKTVPSEAR